MKKLLLPILLALAITPMANVSASPVLDKVAGQTNQYIALVEPCFRSFEKFGSPAWGQAACRQLRLTPATDILVFIEQAQVTLVQHYDALVSKQTDQQQIQQVEQSIRLIFNSLDRLATMFTQIEAQRR
ncbi:hypothetical protein [Pelagibaculum spongiae]|uniref:Uncharacterized protein n=1 Tax=Pelagibaculum spongiae TaxID=2080658 RepID=A0A2V1H0L7_9GAMM|nr:hypothetical protein [Pelagibaculum spongiae]PVZ69613.1 hypothetical protein DC094_09920 [Pelagibaculum spongiae]